MFPETTLFFIASQICVWIALLSQILSFQFKKREYILYFHLCTAFMVWAHFFLLFQTVAWFLLVIAFIRIATACFTTNKRFMFLFLILNLITFFYFFKGYLDIFPLITMTFATFGSFQKNDKNLRYMFIWSSISWITFNTILISPVWIIFSGVSF